MSNGLSHGQCAIRELAGIIECADQPVLQMALLFYRDRNVDFVDAYLTAKAIGDGTAQLYTFDRDFDRLPGAKRRDPGDPV